MSSDLYTEFYSHLKNSKKSKRKMLSEASFNSRELAKKKYQPQWLDYIKNGKPFELEPSGEVVLDKSNLTSTGFGQTPLKDVLDNGTMEEIDNWFKKGTRYEPVLRGEDGDLYSLSDISKSTFTGQGGGSSKKPRDAAYYEMGICVEYNKLQGMDEDRAFKMADVDPSKYEKYKEHLTEVCKPLAKNLPNVGSHLKQTGGESYSPASVWPSSDGTPKTDVFGGGAHRISVKKEGGSQLMSGTAGDAQGVFLGALAFYERYSQKAIKDMQNIVDSIESDFVKLNTDRTVTTIKNDVEDAYIKWRTPQVEQSVRKLKLDAKAKEIKRHVRAELKVVGITDQQGKFEEWFIEGVEPLSERKVMSWFESYWKSQGTKEMQEEVRDVITAGVNHKNLDTEFKKIFENKDFKTWCVYEAASGNFKFSGDNDINASLDPIANEILVFGETGNVKVDKVDDKWAVKYSNKVDVQVGFKTSGRSKATAFRLTSENVNYDDLCGFEKDMNKIIREEINKTDNDIQQLFEEYNNSRSQLINELSLRNMIQKVKDIGRKLINTLNNKIKMFYTNVIKRVLTNLYKMAQEGIRKFAEYIGIEINGKSEVNVSF